MTAAVEMLKPLRYTPAGVPALELELAHESQQREAGSNCSIKLNLRAIAFGLLAEQLAKCQLGTPLQLTGFLAAGRTGKGCIFHIQAFHI